MSRFRIEYKTEYWRGEPFLKAEGNVEVVYSSEVEEIKNKLYALGIKYEDIKVYSIERMSNLQVTRG